MQIFYWHRLHDLIDIEQNLKKGAVLAGYTDTVLGLFAHGTKEGFLALNSAKNREKKPYICLVGTPEKAKKLINPKDYGLLINIAPYIWPGPITAIFHVSPEYNFVSENNTIAIRIPNHPHLLKLLENFDTLFSTSANISGQPTPTNLTELDESIKSHLGGFIEDNKASKKKITPSTIIRVEENKIVIVRGELTEEVKQTLINAGFVF